MQLILVLYSVAVGLGCSLDLCISNASFAAFNAFKCQLFREVRLLTLSCKYTFYRCIDLTGQMALAAEDRGYIFSSGTLQGKKGMFYPLPSK